MGVDFAADKGEEIASVLSGQVVKTGTGELRGNYIVVRHRSGLQTLYQHLTCSYVRVGEHRGRSPNCTGSNKECGIGRSFNGEEWQGKVIK